MLKTYSFSGFARFVMWGERSWEEFNDAVCVLKCMRSTRGVREDNDDRHWDRGGGFEERDAREEEEEEEEES